MGMEVDFTVNGSPWEERPNVWLAVHRIVQESLTNAGRHAPGSPVTVLVNWSAEAVELRVSNPAEGAAAEHGFGILGMIERVRLLGGEASVGFSRPDQFEVAVSLPANLTGT